LLLTKGRIGFVGQARKCEKRQQAQICKGIRIESSQKGATVMLRLYFYAKSADNLEGGLNFIPACYYTAVCINNNNRGT
jgi:hypothetical protein